MVHQNSTNNFIPSHISGINASIISKAVGSSLKDDNVNINKKQIPLLDISSLENIVKENRTKHNINKDIMELFPDVEFCADLISQSILSPGDMYTRGLNLSLPELNIGTELKEIILTEIKSQLKNYKFEENQSKYIKKAMFTDGCYAEVYIPEAAFDEIVNPDNENPDGEITIENYSNKIRKTSSGIFNSELPLNSLSFFKDLTTESSIKDISISSSIESLLNISFTDNLNSINDKELEKDIIVKQSNKYRLNKENSIDDKKSINKELTIRELFRNPDNYETMEQVKVNSYKSARRKSIGRPLVLKIEPYAIKPIWTGTPDNHIGYFLLLDEKGSPVRETSDLDGVGGDMQNNTDVANRNNGNPSSVVNNLINKIRSSLSTMTGTHSGGEIEDDDKIYGKILEEVFVKKLNETPLSDIGSFNENQHFFNIMFNRSIKGQHTRVLFLPYDVVMYYAYDYKQNGIGRSKLEKVSSLYSLRAILLFANLMAHIKNSVPRVKVNAVIDPDDPDVDNTMRIIIEQTIKQQEFSNPFGIQPTMKDLTNWVKYNGYGFKFDHPSIAQTTIEKEDTNRNVPIPEDNITEKIEEMIYMQYGLNLDQVKTGMNQANFATTLINQNKMFTSRIMTQQDITIPMISRHISTIIRNDAVIRNNITDILNSRSKQVKTLVNKFKINKKDVSDVLLDMIIDDITVILPKPESIEGDKIKEILTEQSDSIDIFLENLFNSDVMDAYNVGEELNGKIDVFKGLIKSMMLKEWAIENNFMTGFHDFLTLDDEGKSINNYLDQFKDMFNNFSKIAIPFSKDITKMVKKVNNKLVEINNGEDESEENVDNDEDNGMDDSGDGDIADTSSGDNNVDDSESNDDFGDDIGTSDEENQSDKIPDDVEEGVEPEVSEEDNTDKEEK